LSSVGAGAGASLFLVQPPHARAGAASAEIVMCYMGSLSHARDELVKGPRGSCA